MKKLLLLSGLGLIATSLQAQNTLTPTRTMGQGTVKARMDAQFSIPSLGSATKKTPNTPFFPTAIGTKENVGKSTYDLQTNGSMPRRVLQKGNKISCFWTYSSEANVTSTSPFTDRGTGYAHFDGTSWSAAPTARLEGLRTGFSSAFYTGDGFEAYIAHDAAASSMQLGKKNGPWSLNQLTTSLTNAPIWPAAASSGNWLYVLGAASDSNTHTNGVRNGVFFSRSSDNGATWIDNMIPMPLLDSVNLYRAGGNSYAISANGPHVAVLIGDMGADLMLYQSSDNGANWTKKVVFDWPKDNFDFASQTSTDFDNDGIVDTIETNDGSHSLVLSSTGVAHVAFPIIRVLKDGSSTGFSFFFNALLGYYNSAADSVQVVDNIFLTTHDCDGDNTFSIGDNYTGATATAPDAAYNTIGTITSPSISIVEGANPKVLIAYTAIMDADTTIDDIDHPFWFGSSFLAGQNYRDVLVVGTEDGGTNWTFPVNVSRTAHFEEMFVSTPEVIVGDNFPILYQGDIEPGTILQNEDIYDQDFQNTMILQNVSIANIFTEGALSTAPCGQVELPLGTKHIISNINNNLQVYPNPSNDVISFELPQSAANVSYNYTIQDITGRVVMTGNAVAGKKISVSNLSNGMYSLQIQNGNAKVSGKFVKQ